jgi:hypothetical protein
MPPETVETASNATLSVDNLGPQILIVLPLPAPFDPLHVHIPASEIATPSNPDDPKTTKFVESWMKTILIKAFRKLDLVIEEYNLSGNADHLNVLKSTLEYSNPTKKTFEHYL